jgi:hypothetical protein
MTTPSTNTATTSKKTTLTVFMMRHGERLDEASRRRKADGAASGEDKLGKRGGALRCRQDRWLAAHAALERGSALFTVRTPSSTLLSTNLLTRAHPQLCIRTSC